MASAPKKKPHEDEDHCQVWDILYKATRHRYIAIKVTLSENALSVAHHHANPSWFA